MAVLNIRNAIDWLKTRVVASKFDPSQPRDTDGKWTGGRNKDIGKALTSQTKSRGQAEYHREEKERFRELAEQAGAKAKQSTNLEEKRLHDEIKAVHERFAAHHEQREIKAKATHSRAAKRVRDLVGKT